MMKILNKCILSTLVYNLFLDRQRNYFIYTAIFLRDIEIHIFKNTTGRKKRVRSYQRLNIAISFLTNIGITLTL